MYRVGSKEGEKICYEELKMEKQEKEGRIHHKKITITSLNIMPSPYKT